MGSSGSGGGSGLHTVLDPLNLFGSRAKPAQGGVPPAQIAQPHPLPGPQQGQQNPLTQYIMQLTRMG